MAATIKEVKHQRDTLREENQELNQKLAASIKEVKVQRDTLSKENQELNQKLLARIKEMKQQSDTLSQENHKLNEKLAQEQVQCSWSTQTKQCLGLSYLDTVTSADDCQSVCCKMGRDLCTTWQYLGCGPLSLLVYGDGLNKALKNLTY